MKAGDQATTNETKKGVGLMSLDEEKADYCVAERKYNCVSTERGGTSTYPKNGDRSNTMLREIIV